jgi:hypothetical protein
MPSLCPAARACQRRGICPAGLVPSLRACTLRARHGIRSPCLPSALRPAPAEGGASAPPGLCRACGLVRFGRGMASVHHAVPLSCGLRPSSGDIIPHNAKKGNRRPRHASHPLSALFFRCGRGPILMAPARAAGTLPPILFYFLSPPYLLSPPLLPVKCFPAVLGRRRQAYLSCTPRGREGDLRNMIFPFPFERPTGPPCFKRAGRRGAGLAPSARIRQTPAAKGSRHMSERPLCFSGCAFVPPPGFFRALRLRHKPLPAPRQLVSNMQNGRPAGARSVFWL